MKIFLFLFRNVYIFIRNIQGGSSFIQLNISFPATSQVLNERDNYGGNEKTCV